MRYVASVPQYVLLNKRPCLGQAYAKRELLSNWLQSCYSAAMLNNIRVSPDLDPRTEEADCDCVRKAHHVMLVPGAAITIYTALCEANPIPMAITPLSLALNLHGHLQRGGRKHASYVVLCTNPRVSNSGASNSPLPPQLLYSP